MSLLIIRISLNQCNVFSLDCKASLQSELLEESGFDYYYIPTVFNNKGYTTAEKENGFGLRFRVINPVLKIPFFIVYCRPIFEPHI